MDNKEDKKDDLLEEKGKKRVDIDTIKSSRKGFMGFFESTLRRFKMITSLFLIMLLCFLVCILIGMSLIPSVYIVSYARKISANWYELYHYAFIALSISLAYFAYGYTLLFLAPAFNFFMPTRIKPWRGIYYSLSTVPWCFHNAFTYVMRYTFLFFITPTPFNTLFYKMMGMKLGRGVQINSTNISDPALIEMADKVTIGGSATIIGHYASGGFLILAPVKIGKGATVGMRAIVMGDVEIGEKARILPNSVVMPKTRIPAREIWGGIPAVFIRKTGEK